MCRYRYGTRINYFSLILCEDARVVKGALCKSAIRQFESDSSLDVALVAQMEEQQPSKL